MRDSWPLALVLLLGRLQELCQLLAAADPLSIDEDLRGGRHFMLRLEGVDLIAGGQEMVFKRQTGILKHALGKQSERTNVIRQDHSMQYDVVIFRHSSLLSR